MRTIITTCERCGHEKVEQAGQVTGAGFTYVRVSAREVYKPEGGLFNMPQMEVCVRCAETLRALLASQVRRWKQNLDHFTDKQLRDLAREDGSTCLVK